MKAAVLTVSDGVARGEREDRSGDLLAELLAEEGFDVERRVVPDEREPIAEALVALARAGIRVEGAAAAGLAALPQLQDIDGPIVLIVTGRNIEDELFTRALERPETFPD